jgi:hypothetical protein
MLEARIIREPIGRDELTEIAQSGFGDMVKAVVDVSRAVMAIGGELHSDGEALLLENGSRQPDLWGINLYPGEPEPDWLEFDSRSTSVLRRTIGAGVSRTKSRVPRSVESFGC